jgi:Stage II sporulation protein E (SpoIIE)
MEVGGSPLVRVPARTDALTGPLPVESPGLSESAKGRRSGVRIGSRGHPLALVHRAAGCVQAVGRPGTLLRLLPDPELHDSRCLLRAGDSLTLFTDGVTEARSHIDRSRYGDRRIHDPVAGPGSMPAARIANAIQRVVQNFRGGKINDDTVTLVMTVPRHETGGQPGHGGSWLPTRSRVPGCPGHGSPGGQLRPATTI